MRPLHHGITARRTTICAISAGGIIMRGRRLAVVVGLSVAILGVVAHLRAQSPPATPSVSQVAYLKASNPQVGAHFGCGGALDGHAGIGVAISEDGNTIAVGAPHESSNAKGINGN